MREWGLAIAAAVGSAAASVAGAWVKWRRSSGTVQTSDAGDLWQESRDIRDFLKEQISALEVKVDQLEERVHTLMKANEGLQYALIEQRNEREDFSREIERLRASNGELLQALNDHGITHP